MHPAAKHKFYLTTRVLLHRLLLHLCLPLSLHMATAVGYPRNALQMGVLCRRDGLVTAYVCLHVNFVCVHVHMYIYIYTYVVSNGEGRIGDYVCVSA